MKLLKILAEVLETTPAYQQQVDAIIEKGGKFLGSGDYGSVYALDGKAYKVTTDEVELEHAEILKGKDTEYFAKIYDVIAINPKLGIIVMDIMKPNTTDIPPHFYTELEAEAEQLGIDPEELDIRPDNFMIGPDGKIKMTDV